MISTPAADITSGVKSPLTGNQAPAPLALVEPPWLFPMTSPTGRRRIPGTPDPGQQTSEGRTAIAVVLAGQVEVVMTQFVEDDLLQVLQVKLRIH